MHDLGFRRRPDLYNNKTRKTLLKTTRRAIKMSKKLFAVSAFTKDELVSLYHVSADKIVVSPNAADTNVCRVLPREQTDAVLARHRMGKHFFLFVGRLEAKKNLTTVIRAFELFKRWRGLGDPFELVLVGKAGFGFETIKKYYEGSPVKDQIRSLGYLPEEEVATLTNAATAYVFPSWYEGFGIPNLEAMACGVPLITSDIPVHREVAGDAAVFVKPGEPEAWAKAMRRVVEEHGLREQLVAAGAQNMQRYSWAGSAQIILETLRSLLQ